MSADQGPITCRACGGDTWTFTVPGIAPVTTSLSDRQLAMSMLLKALWRRLYVRSQCKKCGHVNEVYFSDKPGFIAHVRAKMGLRRISGFEDMPAETVRDWAKENLTVTEDLAPYLTIYGRLKD